MTDYLIAMGVVGGIASLALSRLATKGIFNPNIILRHMIVEIVGIGAGAPFLVAAFKARPIRKEVNPFSVLEPDEHLENAIEVQAGSDRYLIVQKNVNTVDGKRYANLIGQKVPSGSVLVEAGADDLKTLQLNTLIIARGSNGTFKYALLRRSSWIDTQGRQMSKISLSGDAYLPVRQQDLLA